MEGWGEFIGLDIAKEHRKRHKIKQAKWKICLAHSASQRFPMVSITSWSVAKSCTWAYFFVGESQNRSAIVMNKQNLEADANFTGHPPIPPGITDARFRWKGVTLQIHFASERRSYTVIKWWVPRHAVTHAEAMKLKIIFGTNINLRDGCHRAEQKTIWWTQHIHES